MSSPASGQYTYRPKKAYSRKVAKAQRSVAALVARSGGSYSALAPRRVPFSQWSSSAMQGGGGAYRVGPGPEKKFIDLSSTAFNIPFQAVGSPQTGPGTFVLQLINGCALGSDSTTRIGRQIQMKSLQFRFAVGVAQATGGTYPAGAIAGHVRVLVVYDQQANGAAPAGTDILVNATTYGPTSPMNLNNRERFKVLSDKIVLLDPQGPGSQMVKVYKKLYLPVIFNAGNAGTIGDIQTGSIYVYLSTSVQATGAGTLGAAWYSRIRFTDF